jgi:type I restriction enzyme S subunit
MKNGLQIKSLQSLCDDFKQDIVDGPFGSELQRKDYITEGIPVLKIQNVKPFAIELKKMDYVSPTKFQELRRHSFRRGDIVITKLGSPLGASAIVGELDEGIIVADLVRIRTQRINTKYLCYHLNSQSTNDFINSMQKGTTRPRVTLSVVRELPIFVPSPAEQQRIVVILDAAFEGIAAAKANAERNLQNTRALFESHLQAVFTQRGPGWREKTLIEVSREFGRGKSKHRPRGDAKLLGGKYPLIQTGDVANAKQFITTYSQTYNEVGLAQSKLWPRGTVCIAIVGANVAETAILNIEACFPDSVIGLVVDDQQADAEYIQYLLSFFKAILKEKGKGTARDNINIGTFEGQGFPFPAVDMQKKIVGKLNALSTETHRLTSLYIRKLAMFEDLKKSLLHKAFTGQL